VSFQVIKTFKASNDPDYEAKKNRVLELYDIADGKAPPGPGDPTVVFCMDEFGPLNLQPTPASSGPVGRRQRRPSSTPPASPSGDLHPSPRCPASAATSRGGTATPTTRHFASL
jgi:hypothetical protein